MGKNRVLEYYEGNPDTVIDNKDGKTVFNWQDKDAISFGYFPVSLDDSYEFIAGRGMHIKLSEMACDKLFGKAKHHISSYYHTFLRDQCYDKAYGLGRYWKTPGILAFWVSPSKKTLEDVVNKLNLNLDDVIVTKEDEAVANITIRKYLNRQYDEDDGEAEVKSIPFRIDPKVRDTIEKYNEPEKSWQIQKEKNGWDTIAQRNAMIYQEEKEPKKDIKENNKHMKKNNYTKEFSNYLQIMSEALDKKDFAVYDAAKEMLEETVDDCKKEEALLKEMNTTNFGVLNHIFEEALPTLIKTNKRAVRNVIKTIKEDKNLMAEFNFYNLINKYNSKISEMVSPEMMFEKLNKTILEKINPKEVRESNKKLRSVMSESGIIPLCHVGAEKMKLYESGHYMLSTAPSMSNVYDMYESRNDVINYMESHKNDAVTETIKPEKLINDFENSLKEKLTESEISFVQQITDFRSPIAEQRKEKLFNKFKNECIDKINEMLKEDADNVGLKGLSDQINEMKFNKETIVKDIAKLLEIRDILMDD